MRSTFPNRLCLGVRVWSSFEAGDCASAYRSLNHAAVDLTPGCKNDLRDDARSLREGGQQHAWNQLQEKTAPPLPGIPAIRVQAKSVPHPVPDGSVARRALLERLAASPATLVTVSAPAGYGKTTFLAQAAAQERRAVAWVSLDAHDDDPASLVASSPRPCTTSDRSIPRSSKRSPARRSRRGPPSPAEQRAGSPSGRRPVHR